MIIRADARSLPLVDGCVDCCVTSPPYWGLRDYGHGDQIGLERTPAEYVAALVGVFAEVRRVLSDDGTAWLNLGDTYATRWSSKQAVGRAGFADARIGRGGQTPDGLKDKDLVGIPWMVAFALRDAGWYLRSDIIWSKPNPMPESITDRPTKAHEYVFLLTKSERYAYDQAAIYEPYAESTLREAEEGYEGLGLKDYATAGVQNPSDTKRRIIESVRRKNKESGDRRRVGVNDWDKRDNVERLDRESHHGRIRSDRAERQNNLRANANAADDYDLRINVGRNKRTVWTISTQPYNGAHFATMPEALAEPCILAGCPAGGLVLDPFLGSGTVGAVAARLGRRWVGTDLSYQDLAQRRTAQRGLMFAEPT